MQTASVVRPRAREGAKRLPGRGFQKVHGLTAQGDLHTAAANRYKNAFKITGILLRQYINK